MHAQVSVDERGLVAGQHRFVRLVEHDDARHARHALGKQFVRDALVPEFAELASARVETNEQIVVDNVALVAAPARCGRDAPDAAESACVPDVSGVVLTHARRAICVAHRLKYETDLTRGRLEFRPLLTRQFLHHFVDRFAIRAPFEFRRGFAHHFGEFLRAERGDDTLHFGFDLVA